MRLKLNLDREKDQTVRGARLLAIVLVVSFIVLNLLVSVWSHRLFYYKKLEIIRTAQNPNLVFVGSSIVDSGVVPDAVAQGAKGASFRPLNAALGAAQPPEQRLLFQYAVRTHPGIQELVVGFWDFQQTKPDHARVTDLVGNRMVGFDRRFPISEVGSAYGFGPLEKAELEGLRNIPVLANRGNAWQYVDRLHDSASFEGLRRSLESLGLLRQGTAASERIKNFAAAEAGSPDDFDAQARTFLEHPDHFNSSYESILTQAQSAGMSMVFVVMPVSPYHRATFYSRPMWREYVAAITRLAGQRGIQVIDASDWMPNDWEFEDHLHMTPPAARDFSIRLGAELAALR